MLFSKGRRACVINKDQTLILNLLNHKVSEASIELHDQNYLGKQTGLFITLRENRGKVKLKIKDNRPTLIVTLNITARLDDTNITVSPEELAKSYIVPDNVLRDVEEMIEGKLHEIFTLSVEKNCDVFEIKDKLFRTQNKYYEGYKDIIINETSFSANVMAKSFK